MAITVREFLVKAKLVKDDQAEKSATASGPSSLPVSAEAQEDIIAECVSQVLDIINQEKER